MKKKIEIVSILILLISMMSFIPELSAKASKEEEGTELYIVYDNSQSMGAGTAWCKAAYAIETLVAMMDDNDSITIYFMKDESPYFDRMKIEEWAGSKDTLQKDIHNKLENLQYTENTYINGLYQAIQDINKSSGKNRRLLILSDGEFNRDGESKIKEDVDLNRELPGVSSYYFKMNQDVKTEKGNAVDHIAEGYKPFQGNESDMLQVFMEISNEIYDRQPIEAAQNGDRISGALELPAKRLIVFVQSQEGSLVDEQIVDKSGKLAEASGTSYQSLAGDDKKSTDFSYYAGIKTFTIEPLIPAGTYDIVIPENTEAAIYVEYDVQYAVCLEDESGREWNILEEEPEEKFREGSYRLNVKLMDSLNNQAVEKAKLNAGIQSNLLLEGNTKLDTAGYEPFNLSEGPHTISGEISWEDGSSQDIEASFEIGHRLGEIELEMSDKEFNIDGIRAGTESFLVKVLEDGMDISETEGFKLECESKAEQVKCEIEKIPGGWNVYPKLPEAGIGAAEYEEGTELTLKLTGEIDGETVEESEDYTVSYYALSQKITFENTSVDVRNVFDLFLNNKVRLTPLIGGEPIKDTDIVEEIEVSVPEDSMSAGAEIVKKEAVMENGIWQIELVFKTGWKFWQFIDGYTMKGNVNVTLERYQAKCSGETPFTVAVGKLEKAGRMALLVFAVLILWILWILVRKIGLRSSFLWLPVSAECKTSYGRIVDTIRIPVEKRRIKNIIRPLHPMIAISLGDVKFINFSSRIPDKIFIKRRIGSGKCVIVNIEELAECGCIVNGSDRKITNLDNEFDIREGLEWKLQGTRDTVVRIKKKGSDGK